MATKLYPPQLEGALPAFYKTYDTNGKLKGLTLTIPFGINRTVSYSSISNIALRLRTTSTNTYLIADKKAVQMDLDNGKAVFKFDYDETDEDTDKTASLINEGQYYRVQLAFIDIDGTIGYYSTVGIIKCVAKPTVYIDNY